MLQYSMPKRKSIKAKRTPSDPNLIAKIIVDKTIQEPVKHKNPAAVALGRLGGLKGGVARAEKLTKKRRSEIAKKAAQARWNK